MLTPRERFQELAGKWFLSEPALFAVYCTHDLEENVRIQCGIRSGQGRIEYNPDQVNLMSDPEFEQRMKAEMVRLCLRHPYERQPIGCCRQALQMGSDMVISPAYHLPLLKLAEPKDMAFPEGQHFEWYADAVNDKLREQRKAQGSVDGEDQDQDNQPSPDGGQSSQDGQSDGEGDQQGQPGEGEGQNPGEGTGQSSDGSQSGDGNAQEGKGSGASGKDGNNPSDGGKDGKDGEHGQSQKGAQAGKPQGGASAPGSAQGGQQGANPGSGDGNAEQQFVDNGYTGLWREDEERMEQLKEVIQGISSWGTLPGQMVGVIQKALEGRIDYRKVLRAFQTSVISTNRTLTRMRPNRRFGFDAMGSKHDMSSKLLVAVDVSGSVTDKALSKFFRIITNFFKYGVDAIDVVQFDAAVCPEVMDLKTGSKEIKAKKVEIHGRGGTNFQCVVNYLKEHNTYDGLIIFTDGYAPAPTINFPTRAKLLWVTETEQQYNEGKDWMKKLGRACFIK